jgi:UV DNA damage repair endonuclease
MTTITPRLGFACKWIDHAGQIDGIKPTDDCKKYNTGSTTISWLNRQSKAVAEEKLWNLMKQNIEATRMLVERVGTLDDSLKMVRISSDLLPAYTEPSWSYFWQRTDVREYCERHFGVVGDRARASNVRLSFHPGQFTVLASADPGIVNRSIEEFEYHADMARYMGYGKSFQDFKINVHISGRAGPEGIRQAYKRLSPEARNTITIENEENAWGLDDCLSLSDLLPIVLDIHHHWVREGEYLAPSSEQVQRVVDSWRGVRPTLHYSVSRESWLVGHDTNTLPCRDSLIAAGIKKQKLRAHGNFYWNNAVNDWALQYLATHDIMCESKAKNLASIELANYAKTYGLV